MTIWKLGKVSSDFVALGKSCEKYSNTNYGAAHLATATFVQTFCPIQNFSICLFLSQKHSY